MSYNNDYRSCVRSFNEYFKDQLPKSRPIYYVTNSSMSNYNTSSYSSTSNSNQNIYSAMGNIQKQSGPCYSGLS